ncbi:endolytic transglycosylase MltG [Arthrobacter sp. efr-133-TYG-104]|uniref:endolytic transglycosylase MltG n=1 Tax=Arthrobacter sp. efr-133-TYG-104 TaxID=3040324 RepID=UPI002550B690|nr:endolytic transglycosylase MltG [Arthrobacter sp. efr-133-TYG-104]
MSPVNNDPSSGTAGGGMPLTRKELRARERFLATQNQDVITFPEATPGEAGGSADVEPELPRPVPAVRRPFGEQRDPLNFTPPPARSHQDPTHQDPTHPDPTHPGEPEQGEPQQPHEHIPVHEETGHDAAVHDGAVHPDVVEDVEHHDLVHDEAVHDDAVHHDVVLHEAEQDAHVAEADFAHHDDFLEEHHLGEEHFDEHTLEEHALEGHPLEEHPLDAQHELLTPVKPAVSKAAAKKARRRRRILALLITLVVFVTAIAVGAQFLKPLLGMDKVTDYPGPGTGSVTITVPAGSGPKQVAADLVANNVVANADAFVKEFVAEGGELAPGDFTFRTQMKNKDAAAILLNKDASKVMYFALSAGLRISESLDAISKGSGIPLQQLNALNQAPGQFGLPAKAKNLEGYLAPGEYRFDLGTSAKDIIQKLVNTTLDELKSQGITDPAKQYDVVTIASIVQAEGGQADYGNVAGAIYNRLKPNNTETAGLIQSDATVTYGLGRKSFHLTDAEKADKSNPYNTYANPGLPAGPIGSPGKTAIDAAAKPTANDYLYWVTINLDTKETKFSKTLAEHLTYVAQYNAWCDANPGRCV